MGNSWQKRLMKWNMKLQGYMRGRYGVLDKLGKTLLVTSLILMIGNIFLRTNLLRWAAILLLILVYYRFFSKKIYVRSNENQKYIGLVTAGQKKVNYVKERVQNRKSHVYFSCPECKQHLRAPKNRGTIKVTCSKCQTQFTKNV